MLTTLEECQVLINLLNIANKASGLESAEVCVHFKKKVEMEAKRIQDEAKLPKEVPEVNG